MQCDLEKQAFANKMEEIQAALRQELQAVAEDTEKQTKKLSDQFENDNGTAQTVGAVAGAIAGAGPLGATVGTAIGKAIGSLFVIEVTENLHKFSLDLPEIRMVDQHWSLDLPEITMADNDIIFTVPTLVMKTVPGPKIPRIVVKMVQRCLDLPFGGRACTDIPETTVEWEDSYYDTPTWENREQRIVIGLPQVTMKRQDMVVGVPEVSMKTQEFSFSIPSITIRFAKDAGEKLAAAAAEIAISSKSLISQKQQAMKERMRNELVDPATKMFDCFRGVILAERKKVEVTFQPQLDTIANSIITMKSQQVPEADPNFVKVKADADALMKAREVQLKPFDDALAKLNTEAEAALHKFINAE